MAASAILEVDVFVANNGYRWDSHDKFQQVVSWKIDVSGIHSSYVCFIELLPLRMCQESECEIVPVEVPAFVRILILSFVRKCGTFTCPNRFLYVVTCPKVLMFFISDRFKKYM